MNTFVHLDHLAQRRRIRIDHVVAQNDRERFVPYEIPGHEYRMTEPERLTLPHIGDADGTRDLPNLFELRRLAPLSEEAFQLDRDVEVILDCVLTAPGDDDDVGDARLRSLLDAVLDDRLVDQHEHLLGLRLRSREKASTESSSGEDGFPNRRDHWRPSYPRSAVIGSKAA